MKQHQQQPPTIAILGTGTLSEEILARLLRDEGYDARLLPETRPTGPTDGRPEDADVLLLAPDRKGGGRTSYLGATRSTPDATPAVPLLQLPPTLKLALLDEPAVSVPWREQFEGLLHQIEAALGRAPAAEAEEAI